MNKKDTLKDLIKQFPELPGIYKMLDSNRNIIYIGKSKCLRKRVLSYFVSSPKWEKVNRMVTMINDIEYVVTDTHLEARLLECELIKKHQPRFNAQMKNDQRYIYIKVNTYNPHHSLSVVAARENDCFGPFRSKYSMSDFLCKLKNIYPIRNSEGNGYEFDYNLFPVKLAPESFESNRKHLLELFHDESNLLRLIEALQTRLAEVVSDYRYELASYYRDIILGFTIIMRGLDGYKNLSTSDILLKLSIPTGYKLFYVSGGYIINNKIVHELDNDIIQDFINDNRKRLSSFIPLVMDEKSGIDYRDVLYSEISDLPEEMVEIL